MTDQNQERETIIMAVHLTPFIYIIIFVLLFVFAVVLQRKQWKYAISQIELKAHTVQAILLERITLQHNLITQLRKEIHDSPGQLLFVAKINLNMLEEYEQPPEYMQYLKKTNDLISQSIHELRALMKRMEEESVPTERLIEGIRYALEKIRKNSPTDTRLIITGESYSVPKAHEIILLKAVEEVLAFLMKPMPPDEIKVVLDFAFADLKLSLHIKNPQLPVGIDNTPCAEILNQLETRCRLIDFDCAIEEADGIITLQLFARRRKHLWYFMHNYW